MTRGIDTLPIVATDEQLKKPHIINGLAQKAFRNAGYDMSPDNPVENALELGILRVEDADEV